MKLKTKLFVALSACALVGGAVAGISAGRMNIVETKATGETYSGTIYLELGTDTWKSTESQIGLYFIDAEGVFIDWGQLKTPYGGTYLDYDYAGLSSEPAKCIVMRVAAGSEKWATASIWNSDDLFARAGDVDLTVGKNAIWLGNYYENSKYTEYSSYALSKGYIAGGAYQNWTNETAIDNIDLPNIKITDTGNIEAYGEVTLPRSSIKGVWKNIWSETWSCHESIKSAFGDGDKVAGSGNVDVSVGGTYAVYYNTATRNIYFTTATLAAADEWAQSFLSGMVCNGSAITSDNWSTLSGTYAELLPAVRSVFTGVDYMDEKATPSTYYEKAVQRYDFIIKKYTTAKYTDFMGRIDAGKLKTAGSIPALGQYNTDNTAFAVAGVIGIVGIVGTIVLIGFRKKREN